MSGPDLHAPFYLPDGDGFAATASTRGPWDPDHQHGGPPSALLVRAAEAATPGMAVARVTVELLRPVPIGRVTVTVTVEKPGRKATVLDATLSAGAVPCLRARVLCVRTADPGLPEVAHPVAATHPDACAPYTFGFFRWPVGYHTAVALRVARGAWGAGDMALWMRPLAPLVSGEPTSPAQRALLLADAGSGVTAALDPARAAFLNADLTVNLVRPPVGDWLLLDGTTTVGPDGRALADCRLADTRGTVGRACQTLVVEARPARP